MSVRLYKDSDYEEVLSWWRHHDEIAPNPEMLTTDSTFIYELDGVPALCLTVYLTNCKEVAYLENFAGNPKLAGSRRKRIAQDLVNYVCNFAFDKGFKRVLCLAYKNKLKDRYTKLGMTKTLDNLSSFVRELK